MNGGKDQYVNLLALIKRESPKLYEVICELCLDGTFRTQRYENTFLMPGDTLITKVRNLVEDDKDNEAISLLRSLILKGHLKETDFKKGANIGTLQFGSYVLADPEDVGKNLVVSDSKRHKKTIILTKKDAKATIVYYYDGKDFPKTVEGKSGGLTFVGAGISGGKESEELKTIHHLTKDFIVEGNCKKTVENFFKGVTAALTVLQNKEDDKFARAKYYLAANPILTWFFLTMPGHNGALVSSEDIKDIAWESLSDFSIINECENFEYNLNESLFKKINGKRSQLISEQGDKATLSKAIKDAYHKMTPVLNKEGALDQTLSDNVALKILIDELRFMFEGSVSTWGQVDDAVKTLGHVNWNQPEKSHVMCNNSTYSQIKGTEAFMSGPVTFVKSAYFLYVPLTTMIEEKLLKCLEGKSGGSKNGGNPSKISNIVFSGGAARKQVKKTNTDLKLRAIVKVLSKSQREALKGML